jgi:hypothetical protein
MKTSFHYLFLALFLFNVASVSAQLEWVVKPIVEEDVFFYLPEQSTTHIIVGKKPNPQRLQRLDGSYAFGGQAFTRLQVVPSSGLWSGLTADEQPIIFNREEKVLSDKYDELNNYHRTNILMSKKNDLFGLIDISGKVIRKPKYKNLRRTARGEYLGELPNGQKEVIEVDETDGMTDKRRASSIRSNSSKIKGRIVFRKKSLKRNWPFWGMTDMEGEVILPADRYYSNTQKMHFEEQIMIAIDSKNDKEGVLNKDGKVIVPFIYDKVDHHLLNSRYFITQRADSTYIVDFTGKELVSAEGKGYYPVHDEPLVKEIKDKKARLLNLQLEEVIPGEYRSIKSPIGKSGFFILGRDKKYGFYALPSGNLIAPRFEKTIGPFTRAPLSVKEDGKFGIFDVTGDRFILPPTYNNDLRRHGDYFVGSNYRKDSIKKSDGKFRPIKILTYYLHQNDGTLVYGPSGNKITSLGGDLWNERVGKDSLRVYNFVTNSNHLFTNKGTKVLGDIIKFSDEEYCFTSDFLEDPLAERYELLDKKHKDHSLRRYKLSGKFGLINGREEITPPLYDEIDLKFITYGIKAKVDGKWGVLAKPK